MNERIAGIAGLVVLSLIGVTSLAPAADKIATNSPAQVVASGKTLPKLLDLGATKCIPCKKMAVVLEELKKDYAGKLEVEFIDVWQNPDSAKKYDIRLIPTQIFFDVNGKELFRHEGFFGKEDILTKWKELGVKLAEAK